MKNKTFTFILFSAISLCQAQTIDSIKTLKEVTVTAYKTVNGVGHLPEEKDGIIYAGKKTEVILVDSLDANKAINNTRQILGRIPGLNIAETESAGFTANGIATRGLNPIQSIEMNTGKTVITLVQIFMVTTKRIICLQWKPLVVLKWFEVQLHSNSVLSLVA